jgi:putative tryptophan/tyrosine transport system substrate-binding protein
MQRRQFISLVGGTAVAWPLTARAQQSAIPVIGFLGTSSRLQFASRLEAFHHGLSETGYVDGRNVAIEYRWAEDQYDRLPAFAANLVQQRVDVIFANGPAAPVAKAATSTIPVIFVVGSDPVAVGLVASLNRPGGNVTGATSLNVGTGPKRLELLHELVPTATVIGLLSNPTNSIGVTEPKDVETAAHTLGLYLHVVHASAERDLEPAFATLVQLRANGLVVTTDAFFISQRERLAALASRYAMPTVFQDREFATAGGLASYGGDLKEADHLAGVYTGRVLKGEKPANLPVSQATKVELIINLKTAKALRINVPNTLLGRADEVIE